jgi:asparagine synthase (glutamine-hydrolysing)
MCGIAGIAFRDMLRRAEDSAIAAMAQAIVHRGPDGGGAFCAPGVALAHRRLSIIDLEGGKQPLGNEDGSIQVVFNGEIYNYRELRKDLEGRGHRFATSSDTEVLVHLYEEEGEHLVAKLRGMFAFAIWDSKRKRLMLARDRVGIKPLYFLRDDEKLLFGSELKSILAYGSVSREIDPAALEDYLVYGMVPGTRTIFRGIEKLAAGQVLVVEPGNWNRMPRSYWQLRFESDESLSDVQWEEQILAKLDEIVDRHLIADVPVGAFLSGGIDSSVVTAIAAAKLREPIQTFSIGFREDKFNELPYARMTANKYGTRHTEEVVTADAAGMLDKLCWHYDEPFADSSAIPTMLVSQLAAQHVKVVLSGDGGDEAFGGYARYPHDLREGALRRGLPLWLRSSLLARLAWVWPKADWLPRPMRLKTALTNLSLGADVAYANTLSCCRMPLRRQLLSREVSARLNGHQPERIICDAYATSNDPLSSMIAADVGTLLPDDFLVKVDRASMAYGLEVRPPLLDHELLELAATIPSKHKIRGGQTKWIFKQACRHLLPDGLLSRPKRGFEIPVDAWFRDSLGPMFRDVALSHHNPIAGLIDLGRAAEIFDDHLSGRGRHGQILWSLMVLSRWAEQHMNSQTNRPLPTARPLSICQSS